ncbi:nicotinate-nucleotide--dimethylbenzimidazole phosphoribosyltransferase [Neptunomonas sp. XY-337]|uniref:nicotinate-nucleotide--dimethylbenzimidazole phosphoribosyltransferase n=1 Tax=Neptunomonas sp. XY-337 TaxID=2561897 RepID=UPI0010AA1A3F|nr:nicotinate-nucleotide--dimethylbenzimidazole phosphoribosyltransferase [Neptunomonas sp. XY-337]
MSFDWLNQPAHSINHSAQTAAAARQMQLTKPPGALGQLEALAIRLAGLQGRERPTLEAIKIHLFAADHGSAASGVSPYPQAVTAQMVSNFAHGGAAISVLARQHNADLKITCLGTVAPLEQGLDNVIDAFIAPQTRSFTEAPAMTRAQLQLAIDAGKSAVDEQGSTDLFIGGEMGIGNTTSAAAIVAVLLEQPVAMVVGAGAGLNESGIDRKARYIEKALRLHQPQLTDPLSVLQCLGGFEIAALVGAYVRAAQHGITVLVDGYICSAAALVAMRINPSISDWLVLSHRSAEPGFKIVESQFCAPALFDLGLRLGEGSGAALAIPLLRSACQLHQDMATFAQAGVATKEE